MVQFGWGSKQRRIQAAEIDSTSAIGRIDRAGQGTDQEAAARGRRAGADRPPGDRRRRRLGRRQEIGLPVVVKPQDGNQGKGVTVNITTEEQIDRGLRTAARDSATTVMVERFLPGHDYRLLVVGNKLVAAARRDPPQVVGDGVHTVRELVDMVNADPRRGSGHSTSLTKIRFDDIAIARLALQDLDADSDAEQAASA